MNGERLKICKNHIEQYLLKNPYAHRKALLKARMTVNFSRSLFDRALTELRREKKVGLFCHKYWGIITE